MIRAAGSLLTSLLCAALAAAATPIVVPPGVDRSLLDAAALPEDVELVAFGADGDRLALALPFDGRSTRVEIRRRGLPTREISLPDRVIALAWSGDERPDLWGIRLRPARHRRGDAHLMRFDLERWRASRTVQLPDTARALVWWPLDHALVVASNDSLRTLHLPQLTAGAIFPVPGTPTAVSVLGGSRVLLAQTNRLVEIDLRDRPGRKAMPLRDQIELGSRVSSLAAASDGTHALAAADGRTLRVDLAPLRLDGERPAGSPVPAEPPGDRAPSSKPPPPPVRPPPPMPVVVEPPPVPVPVPSVTAIDDEAQLVGLIAGPAATDVRAVVLLGPDHLLREARRVTPGPDGHWSVSGLAAGRYKIQLDAGGSRVMLSEPPFLLIEVGADDGPQVTPAIRALRVL